MPSLAGPVLVGHHLAGHAVEPGQSGLGYVIEAPPRSEEDLGHGVVGIRRGSHPAPGVGQDRTVGRGVDGPEALVVTVAHRQHDLASLTNRKCPPRPATFQITQG